MCVRYCGTTPSSNSVLPLLQSLCHQVVMMMITMMITMMMITMMMITRMMMVMLERYL